MPKWYVVALGVLAAAPVQASAQHAKAEVIQAVKSFLGGMQTRDSAGLAALLDPNTRFTLLRPGQAGGWQVVVLTGAQYLQIVMNPSTPAAEERIRNPVVQIDGDLASVWTEYQLLVNGAMSHCGTDAFHLVRLGGRWKILNISDTFRQQGCGDPWPK